MRRLIGLAVALVTGVAIATPSVGATNVAPSAPVASVTASTHPVVVRHVRTTTPKRPLLQPVAARAGVSIVRLRAEWQHVAICEVNGNWSMTGPSYSGIGFANSTWLQYGGLRFARYAGEAPRDAQILIGMRVTQGWVPDQFGCSPTGW